MKKILLALFATAMLAMPGFAQVTSEVLNPNQAVVRSSITIYNISIASHTMTRVDSPQLSGSFVAELQNNDASYDACCAFAVDATTVTTSTSYKSCRLVNKLGGTWTISRWFRDLPIYCQTLNTSAAAKIVLVQGK